MHYHAVLEDVGRAELRRAAKFQAPCEVRWTAYLSLRRGGCEQRGRANC